MEKAFGKIRLNGLIAKMEEPGISKTTTRIIQDYLTKRTFRIRLKRTTTKINIANTRRRKNQPSRELAPGGTTIDLQKKYLGIHIARKLILKKGIEETAKKAKARIRMVNVLIEASVRRVGTSNKDADQESGGDTEESRRPSPELKTTGAF